MKSGPVVYSNGNRKERRRLAKKTYGGGRRLAKVLKGDAAKMDPRYGSTGDRPCGHCYEAGRGIVPMKLHRDMQRPCPDAVITVKGERVALYGLALGKFRRQQAVA